MEEQEKEQEVQSSAPPRAAAVNSKCTFDLEENGTLAKI